MRTGQEMTRPLTSSEEATARNILAWNLNEGGSLTLEKCRAIVADVAAEEAYFLACGGDPQYAAHLLQAESAGVLSEDEVVEAFGEYLSKRGEAWEKRKKICNG